MAKEKWKNIKGHEGLYQVSNYGRVKSLAREVSKTLNNKKCTPFYADRILKSCSNSSIYPSVSLSKDNKSKSYAVHRLVVEAFLCSIVKGKEVNHKDGNKLNNNLDNLEIVTHKDNILHAVKSNIMTMDWFRGEKQHKAKLKEKEVIKIRKLLGTKTQREIANIYKVDPATISNIATNKSWRWL